ncbi:MAG: elongation factor G [Paracoccaceae bacterium]|nr:elongation factor G [Paracoccaceae bacterium]
MTRCIAVLGAAGTGKSTLVDALCALENNETTEATHYDTRTARFTFIGDDWVAFDCPGSLEFMQQARDAMLVADAAVICVSPQPEQAVLAAPYIRLAERAGVPAFILINRIDEAQASARDIIEALQSYSTHPVVLRQIPMRDGGKIVGSVDLVSERAWRYRPGEPSDLIEIPDDLIEHEQEARGEFLESLSDYDDWLMEEIIEDREPASDQVYAICARVLKDGAVTPAFIGSALNGNGMFRLMKALRHETPGVAALAERLGGQASAGVFLARHRKHVGKTAYLRALKDIKPGDELGGHALGPISTVGDPKPAQLTEARAGDVVGAIKSDHLGSGQLYGTGEVATPDWHGALTPVFTVGIKAVSDRDDAKMSEALHKLASEDLSLTISTDQETGAHVLAGQGVLHLRRARETLSGDFGVETAEAALAPPLRETITKKADVHFRHRKQSGGSGQFADVKLKVAPAARGEGFSFEQTIHGGSVPRNYIPAVENGAKDATERGPLGFPVVDISVNLYDGQHHAVDSSDMAFRIAGRGGVKEALESASPVLLEPVYDVKFSVPSVYTGSLNPLVSSRRGQVMGFDREESCEGWDVFRAQLPGTALDGLIADLRSITQGVGRYEAEFSHYNEVYGKDADKMIEKRAEMLADA